MSEHTPSPREMVELVRQMVEGRDGVSFPDLFAEDGVLEYPFTTPNFPSVYKGLPAIRALFERMAEARDLFDIDEVTATVHETNDPELVIAEIFHHGQSHVTNRPYQSLALGIIRVRDGKIVHYRDFMNPLAVSELVGRLPDLVASLSGSGTGAGR
jgi:uncharacterized protein